MSPSRVALALFALSCLICRPVAAQEPLVVMNLAAHPDDEDGRTLTYYRHAKNAIAYSIIYTRGEGGQNETGPELYQALGAIRTQETERAARDLGTQVFFLNFYDFGYSKHAYEAFDKWGGKDKVTARIVYMIRKLKPDVIFTNHDTLTVGPRRQHGQHQAVGISGYDAFTLAADPSYHPEQLQDSGVDLWQPKRFFWRRYRSADDYDVAVPVGDVDPTTGVPYYRRAVAALKEHKSQGMGQFAGRVRGDATHFKLIRSATDAPLSETDLTANLPPNRSAHPDLTYLIDSGRMPRLPDGVISVDDSVAVPGQIVHISWSAGDLPNGTDRLQLWGAVDTTISVSTSASTASLRISRGATPSVPKPVFQYKEVYNHAPVVYAFFGKARDLPFEAGYLPVEVAPPLSVMKRADVMRLIPGPNHMPVRIEVFDPNVRMVMVDMRATRNLDGQLMRHASQSFDVSTPGIIAKDLVLRMPPELTPGAYTVSMTTTVTPPSAASSPINTRLNGQIYYAKTPRDLVVGIIQSYDNTLQQALKVLNVQHIMIDSLALARGDFSGINTIIVDIRAYLVRSDLRRYNHHLLDWVKRGGHLIVNYQKTFEWNTEYNDPFDHSRKNPGNFAPYPLRLSHDRVTYEDAPVQILEPDNPIFHVPNEIGDSVWDGWVQERGLYFPREYDSHYTELLETHDPGEAPLRSSTLLAHYGRGTYLYTALGWYRQLKVFNPGVYYLFANMISLPLVDGRGRMESTTN